MAVAAGSSHLSPTSGTPAPLSALISRLSHGDLSRAHGTEGNLQLRVTDGEPSSCPRSADSRQVLAAAQAGRSR